MATFQVNPPEQLPSSLKNGKNAKSRHFERFRIASGLGKET